MLLQRNIMELMLHQIKYNFIFFAAIFFLAVSIEAEEIDANPPIEIIDTTQIIQQTDSQELDTLNNNSSDLSFYESYIEPIIAVVSAALITLLLFSVRSKE